MTLTSRGNTITPIVSFAGLQCLTFAVIVSKFACLRLIVVAVARKCVFINEGKKYRFGHLYLFSLCACT